MLTPSADDAGRSVAARGQPSQMPREAFTLSANNGGVLCWRFSPQNAYNLTMEMKLTPTQEALVARAVAKGMAASAEEFVTAALRNMDTDLDESLEDRLGMSVDEINRELDKGPSGDAQKWEGADAFHEKMLARHQAALSDRS